jgi:UDP-N-acetylglucosamine 3-dehydrogenase
MRPVRIGLSGAGAMGAHHARVLSRLEATELAAVYDVDAARADALAQGYGVPAVPSFAALLERCEAVVVAASTHAHVAQARAAAAAGRHVLVEKPAAPDLAATVALRDALARAPVVVQVGHIEHFNPSVAAVRRLLAGEVPLVVSSRRLGPPSVRSDALDVVTDLMLHDIHVVGRLGAGSLADASAVALGEAPTHYAHATLRFAGGLVAALEASRIAQTRLRSLEVSTADVHITADYARRAVQVARWDERSRRTVVEHVPVGADEPLERELRAFAQAIRAGTPPEVGLDAAVRCMEVVEAVRRSAERRAPGVLWVADGRSEDRGAEGRAGAARARRAPAG